MKRNLLFVLLLALVSCEQTSEKQEAKNNTAVKIKGWKILDTPDYSIQYPSDWQSDQSGQMGSKFVLFSPVNSTEDNFKENVNLIIQDLSGSNMDLDQYTDLSEKQIKAMANNPDLMESTRMKNGNGDFHKLVYSGDQGIYHLTFEQYYWVINDHAFVLTFTSEQDQYKGYKEVGEKIMNSFVLKN